MYKLDIYFIIGKSNGTTNEKTRLALRERRGWNLWREEKEEKLV